MGTHSARHFWAKHKAAAVGKMKLKLYFGRRSEIKNVGPKSLDRGNPYGSSIRLLLNAKGESIVFMVTIGEN